MKNTAQMLHLFILPIIIVATLFLAGCALVMIEEESRRELLEPWIEITGAQMSVSSGALGTDYVVLQTPTAISVHGNDLYLVDIGLHRIFRYDRLQQILTPLAVNLPIQEGMSIAAAERSVYVTLPSYGKVMHFGRNGSEFAPLSAPGFLAYPVFVTVDGRNGNILVVDGYYNHIVVFSNAGVLLTIIRPSQVQSISAIVTVAGKIYVIDSVAKKVVVLEWDGTFSHTFASNEIIEPVAIAAGSGDLLFVGDNFDNSVGAYSLQNAKTPALVTKLRGVGALSESFGSIVGLTAENDILYVADSLNARIQSLLINSNAIYPGRID